MNIKTHLAITIFFILIFLGFVTHKVLFVFVALFATYLPDIDLKNSSLGRKKIFRPLQYFVKHRGFFHSFTFVFFVVILFALFAPYLALGFFLGYGVHLFADSFSQQGIMPLYPWKKMSSGKIITGSKIESLIFAIFIILDLLVFLNIYL